MVLLFTVPFCYLCFVSVMVSCMFISALWSPAGTGLPLGSLVCAVFLCFCHFPMWCSVSGVVLDCIEPNLCLLHYFVILTNIRYDLFYINHFFSRRLGMLWSNSPTKQGDYACEVILCLVLNLSYLYIK